MTDSRGCEHEGTKVETASNRLNGVADPEGATAIRVQNRPFWSENSDFDRGQNFPHENGEKVFRDFKCIFDKS